MALMFTRIFALVTLTSYLAVGTVAVRVFTAKNIDLEFSLNYFSLLENASVGAQEIVSIDTPEQHFAEIKIPVKAFRAAKVAANVPKKVETKVEMAKDEEVVDYKVQIENLPFNEAIVLSPLVMDNQLPSNLVALYRAAPEEVAGMVAKAAVADELSIKMAKSQIVEDAEPTFLEYPTEVVQGQEDSSPPTQVTETVEEIVKKVDNSGLAVEKIVDNSPEEIAVDDLITFDYSSAKKDVVENKAAVITNVTTQAMAPGKVSIKNVPARPKHKKHKPKQDSLLNPAEDMQEEQGFVARQETPKNFPSRVTIHATGTNFKVTNDINGFELRFQDDLSAAVEDYGSGKIVLEEILAQPMMTRSVAILKHGFIPTNVEIILEQGVSELSLPLIEDSAFNEIIAPYEKRGPVGAVLVELDDETELAQLDVPFGKVLLLDGDLKETTKDDHRYQLFVGVQAGNALLSYKAINGLVVSKIIHIHEHEITFDANIYESSAKENVALYEEDLLAKEKSPLIIGGEQVRQFATNIESRKISDHLYKLNYEKGLLGGRKYLELTHQQEPIFIGRRDSDKVVVPSENFMRFVLSKIEGANVGNRCLVQVNLSRKVSRVDVGSESVANSLMTYTQALDNDGKFYDTAGSKTRKIIVVGENQGAPEYSQDAKINLKVTYEDGSVQFLGSYCSPNTYLVEQL